MAQQSPAAAGGCKHQFPVLLLSVFVFLPSLMECRQVPIFNLVPAAQNGLRINLVPADSLRSPNITSTERLKRAVQRSQGRLEKLQMISALNTAKLLGDDRMNDIVSRVSAGTGEFVMQTAIGTPALTFSAILDTGSDLVWAKCKPCTDCTNGSIYDPSRSSTYSKVPCHNSLCKPLPNFSCNRNGDCDYNYAYGDQSTTEGILSFETFNFSSQSIPNIAFGCGQDNQGIGFQEVGGLLGFGRGPLSLVSQLAPTVGNKFSYCLVSVTGSSSQTSPLFLGHTASLNATTVRSTPIIQSRANPSFYYLSLQGISVGGQSLNIPAATFQLQADGSGGFIIDSGTTITYLPQSAYDAVKEALKSSIHLPQVDGSSFGLDLCFTKRGSSNSTVPAVTFHFQGADYDIPPENYLLPLSNNLLCFAMLPSASEGDISIFGNVQQQNFQIVYDNEKNVLSFAPTACDTL